MPQIQICLSTIVCHKDFAMLERPLSAARQVAFARAQVDRLVPGARRSSRRRTVAR